ncbi:hypothetical protein WA1_23020 [Scytonema hofmannii PCC 7110]|uniref:Uncharacterized protein n=1 Tax=Scytonema hofmannii PCC 7110 TaxID=128403 RepID=A0A139X8H4_9CYAN|nr:hypothetical protein WA1_23020 [Scytonema hofmannii PCC 7110]
MRVDTGVNGGQSYGEIEPEKATHQKAGRKYIKPDLTEAISPLHRFANSSMSSGDSVVEMATPKGRNIRPKERRKTD